MSVCLGIWLSWPWHCQNEHLYGYSKRKNLNANIKHITYLKLMYRKICKCYFVGFFFGGGSMFCFVFSRKSLSERPTLLELAQ